MSNASDPKTNPDHVGTSSLVEMPGARSGVQNQHSVIGSSIKIKGTISASDPVYIYGCVEGSIDAPAHRVTVGKEGSVKADISAREVVIMGDVCGNLDGGERVEIRGEGSLTGDLITRRIYVEDGATLNGSIEVQRPKKAEKAEPQREQPAASDRREVQSETDSDLDREQWADLAVSEIA